MYNNKIIKLITILLIIFITLLNFNIKVFAAPTGSDSGRISDPTETPGYFKPSQLGSENELQQKAGLILGIINVVGIVVSVMTLMVLGIKYMFGSVEEKAEYKKTMGMYLLGAVLVFSVTTIPNILYKIAYNSFK